MRLRRSVRGIKTGAAGTIVHVYEGGAGYEVEFIEGRKRPSVLTLAALDLELLPAE
ncbi:MAG: DUF4926 domain-containing protein [Planctomycetes bacterium]|nr:DUF4926 domain-containing protein [Planctomycetota bacterium]